MNTREFLDLTNAHLSLVRTAYWNALAAVMSLERAMQLTEKAFAQRSARAQEHQQEQESHRTRHLSEVEGLFRGKGQDPGRTREKR